MFFEMLDRLIHILDDMDLARVLSPVPPAVGAAEGAR